MKSQHIIRSFLCNNNVMKHIALNGDTTKIFKDIQSKHIKRFSCVSIIEYDI